MRAILLHLDPADWFAAAAAFATRAVFAHLEEDLWAVPRLLRGGWLYHSVMHDNELRLRALAEWAFFYARDCASVCVFANWSPFSEDEPTTLADFHWDHSWQLPSLAFGGTLPPILVPRAIVTIHHAQLRACIATCVRQRTNLVQLTMHTRIRFHGRDHLHPHPIRMQSFEVLPPYMARYGSSAMLDEEILVDRTPAPPPRATATARAVRSRAAKGARASSRAARRKTLLWHR